MIDSARQLVSAAGEVRRICPCEALEDLVLDGDSVAGAEIVDASYSMVVDRVLD